MRRGCRDHEAVDWAVDEAGIRNLPLHLLTAWYSDYGAEALGPLVPTIEDDCRSLLDTTTDAVRHLSPQLQVATQAVHA
jgi:hypothetical protein